MLFKSEPKLTFFGEQNLVFKAQPVFQKSVERDLSILEDVVVFDEEPWGDFLCTQGKTFVSGPGLIFKGTGQPIFYGVKEHDC